MVSQFQHRLFVHAMILGVQGVTQCFTHTFTAGIAAGRFKPGTTASRMLLLRNRPRFSTLSSVRPNQEGLIVGAKDLEGGARGNIDHERTWLVVGDGDLSYSASVASSLNEQGIRLLASVLEDQETHRQVYRNSKKHAEAISSFQRHQVLYGVDATALHRQRFFPGTTTNMTLFDRVIFNFPHWKGKSNNRYNQQLLNGFFQSVVNVIQSETGQVYVALVTGQGGMEARDIQEWKQSWQAPVHANNHGLLLRRVQPFQVDYDLSSHRGVDRAFSPGREPLQYVFGLAKRSGEQEEVIDECYQIAYRHELRIRLNSDGTAATGMNCDDARTMLTLDELQSVVPGLAKRIAPVGIRVEIPWNEVITQEKLSSPPLLVFLVVYAGQSAPLSRATANEIRSRLEMAVQQELGLVIAKPGRVVSKAFPYALLESLRQENVDMPEKN